MKTFRVDLAGILDHMIALLSGEVEEKFDSTVVVNCSGVGYGVIVSLDTFSKLEVGKSTRLFMYEHIREEAHDLFGFLDRNDKQLFEKLLSVNGVGPKMALSIMNIGNNDELSSAIGSSNVTYLSRASGVGRRLAERLVVDLKDSFSESALISRVGSSAQDDALQALLSLGYNQNQALEALSEIDADNTEEQVKQALKALSK